MVMRVEGTSPVIGGDSVLIEGSIVEDGMM